MKTNFIFKNFLAVAAVAIAVTTMSFKLAGEKQTNNWYAVAANGSTLSSTGLSAPPSGCLNTAPKDCALQITVNPGETFPDTVEQAEQMAGEGKLTIHDRKYKN